MIYVNFKAPKLISEFIKELYSKHVDNYGPRRAKTVETYTTSDCDQIQCKDNSFRSFTDVLEIVQTYYPKCTERKLFRILFKVKIFFKEEKQSRMYFRMFFCPAMNKIRITYTEKDVGQGEEKGSENYYSQRIGDDGASWKALLTTLGINSPAELAAFRKRHNC
jgi:hypothetical protein